MENFDFVSFLQELIKEQSGVCRCYSFTDDALVDKCVHEVGVGELHGVDMHEFKSEPVLLFLGLLEISNHLKRSRSLACAWHT